MRVSECGCGCVEVEGGSRILNFERGSKGVRWMRSRRYALDDGVRGLLDVGGRVVGAEEGDCGRRVGAVWVREGGEAADSRGGLTNSLAICREEPKDP